MSIAVQTSESGAVPALTRRRVLAAAAPALLFLLARGVGTLLWWVMAAAHNPGRFDLRIWDADWYLEIAEFGYGQVWLPDAHGVAGGYRPLAFFPGFPALVRPVAAVLGQNYVAAGLVVATLAGVVGAYGVARLARLLGGGRRAELIAVALTAAAPMSLVYTLPYPEALLVALCSWALVAVLQRRWWLAALLTAAAGLTSPMAAPLIPVVIAAALWDIYRNDTGWGAAWVVLAPGGMLAYLLWVQEESEIGYFAITAAGWDNHLDWGVTTGRWVVRAFTASRDLYEGVTAAALIAAVVAVAVLWRRLPWPVWAYTALTVALIVFHSGQVQDRMRLLLSVFPLVVLAAVGLARRSPRVAVATALVLAVAGLWFSAYAVTVWPYSI